MFTKTVSRFLFAISCLLAQPVLADVAGWSVTIQPSRPVALEPVRATIAVTQSCILDPSRTTVRQEGAEIQVQVRSFDDCVPTGGYTSQDITLGQFHAGQFSVRVLLEELQLASGQFTVRDARVMGSTKPLIDYTDLWWNPQESGWGLGIWHHASGQLFGAWFTYRQDGTPMWFTLQPGGWTNTFTYSGPIYQTSGPYYGSAFDPSRVTAAVVGTATITFDSPTSAVFSYSIGGVVSSRRIERMVY